MIFIGGTGRSGTTVLSRILSKHSEICALPTELRFLTDPDGLVNLNYSLCEQWSFYQADYALDRFERLMKSLSRKYRNTYPNSNLGEIVGVERYNRLVGDYISKLSNAHYPNAWAARVGLFRKAVSKTVGMNKFTELFFQKSYNCRVLTEAEFIHYTREFLDGVEAEVVAKCNKRIFLDHTPPNILHVDFLKKLYPNLKIIHIYRDPRDVVSSMSKKDWGNNDVVMNMDLIEDSFKVWNRKKESLSFDDYIEIRFEHLIENPEEISQDICRFLGIKFEEDMCSFDLSHHNIGRWEKQMSDDQKRVINSRYSDLISTLGY